MISPLRMAVTRPAAAVAPMPRQGQRQRQRHRRHRQPGQHILPELARRIATELALPQLQQGQPSHRAPAPSLMLPIEKAGRWGLARRSNQWNFYSGLVIRPAGRLVKGAQGRIPNRRRRRSQRQFAMRGRRRRRQRAPPPALNRSPLLHRHDAVDVPLDEQPMTLLAGVIEEDGDDVGVHVVAHGLRHPVGLW